MMTKKLASILVITALFLSVFSCLVFAKGNEHIRNGGFESIEPNGKPTSWSTSGGSPGKEFILDKSSAYSGEKGLGLKPSGAGVYSSQTISTLVGGAEYTFSAWLKKVDETAGAQVKIEFTGISSAAVRESFKGTVGEWTNVSFKFNAPEEVTTAVVLVRNTAKEGTLYWDDVSVIGEGDVSKKAEPAKPATPAPATPPAESEEEEEFSEYVEMPPWSEELLVDGGFENVDEKMALKDWHALGDWGSVQDAYNITVTSDVVRNGKYSVNIKGSSSNPFISQNIENPVVGATYQLSIWYKTLGAPTKPGFKLEWYQRDDYGTRFMVNSKVGSVGLTNPSDEWKQIVYHFVIPEGCEFFTYLVRVYTSAGGEIDVYFDDVSCYMIEDAPKIPVKVSTDEVFYYNDMKTGFATAKADLTNFSDITNVEFRIKDGDSLVDSKIKTVDSEGNAFWDFSLSNLAQDKKEYVIEAVAKDSAGNTIGNWEEKIMRWPRPTNLRVDGTVLVDGEPFYPVFAYHVHMPHLAHAAEMGINTVQLMSGTAGGGHEGIQRYLDEAAKYGIKCLMPLYGDMKPAGHPDKIESTTVTINKFKDHPGVLGWMVMDEATAHWPGRWDLFYDSYKLIRELDPDHFVYILQNIPSQFGNIGKYADVLAYDPYPPANANLAIRAADYTKMAIEGVNHRKPVWCLNKAFAATLEPVPGINQRLLPSIMDERSLWYQALFAGADVVGYYSYSDAIVKPRTPLHDTPLGEGLIEFYKSGELEESYNHFLKHKYPIFSEVRGEDAWHSAYIKDNAIYMVVLNRHEANKNVTIPIVSNNGEISINGFTAERIYGGSESLSGENTLNLSLEPNAAYVYKIIPNEPIDFSSLQKTKFMDLGGYPWAADAIMELSNKEIIKGVSDNFYVPEANITRADFAYFLINTLGLTSDSIENFADVPHDEYYAKALATGKALGILKGVGDNTFNPYLAISRQDMMVICARGMRLVGKLGDGNATDNVSAFSDKSSIADYAIEDISAMVGEEIIKGNADGTINPLGNATRAEAAVIMHRIYQN